MEEEKVNATAAALCVYTNCYREEGGFRQTDGDVEVHKLGRGIGVAEVVPASDGPSFQLNHGYVVFILCPVSLEWRVPFQL